MSPTLEKTLHNGSSDHDGGLISRLHALHADEFADLRKKVSLFSKKSDQSWTVNSLNLVKHYLTYIFETWKRVVWTILFYPTTVMDLVSLITISSILTIVMTIFLPWCIFANFPIVVETFERVSKKIFNGLGLVNSSYPTMFEELTKEQIKAAKGHLHENIENSPGTQYNRIFNLDASKLLLQCASLMYERTSQSTVHAASVATEHVMFHLPRKAFRGLSLSVGQRIAELCGDEGAKAVAASLHEDSHEENRMVEIAEGHLGLKYTTVSELNSTGASSCGLFWDPEDNFIIVSFRGTNPVDYMEWITDFTVNMRDAGRWLSDYGRVHDGFMDKIFPGRISPGSRMPYDTINEAIRVLADELVKTHNHKYINVWVTGHSLGCALASLAYSRMVCEPRELGSHVVIRDAYLFAAPVCCDAESAASFNNKINRHFPDHPRTMWRVTNGNDVVATGLPDAGDNLEWALGPYNMFAFAHLGCEIKMRPYPEPCIVSGNHIIPGASVTVASALASTSPEPAIANGNATASKPETKAGEPIPDILKPLDLNSTSHGEMSTEFEGQLKERIRSERYRKMQMAQNAPLVGRIIAHGTGFYWNSLQAVGVGHCEWEEDCELSI